MEDRFRKIQRENEEVEHFLLSPIRFLMNFAKWAGLILVALVILAINEFGWIVDLGSRSERARIARADYLQRQLHDFDHPDTSGYTDWAVYDIDFRRQPDPTDPDIDPENRFWDDYLPWNQADTQDHPGDNRTVKAFTTGWGLADGMPHHGIPYCIPSLRPGYAENSFDSAPDSWSKRSDDALDRKGARMYRDYETAALMTAALRSAIVHIKAGKAPVSAPAYCPGTKEGAAIVLAHAPIVRIRYMAIDPSNADTDLGHAFNQAEIIGMCLPASCPDSLTDIHWGTTLYADLFAADAPLNAMQQEAERAMLAMTTEAFWEQAARDNGITDLTSIRTAHDQAVRDLDGELILAHDGS